MENFVDISSNQDIKWKFAVIHHLDSVTQRHPQPISRSNRHMLTHIMSWEEWILNRKVVRWETFVVLFSGLFFSWRCWGDRGFGRLCWRRNLCRIVKIAGRCPLGSFGVRRQESTSSRRGNETISSQLEVHLCVKEK